MHGQELPKFSEGLKVYWKQTVPKNTSHRLYWQDNKYWAKNDEMYLGDLKMSPNPPDDFKKDRVITKKKKENLTKAMTNNFVAKTVRIVP